MSMKINKQVDHSDVIAPLIPDSIRRPDTVPWYDPEAPYTSSYAIRILRYPGDRSVDSVDVVKVQYVIELEKRLKIALDIIKDLMEKNDGRRKKF